MATRIEEIATVCRFCLGRESLMPLSEATKTDFAIKDVFHFTGIQVSSDKLPYAICDECCEMIKNAVNFRQTCLRNDNIFKQLAAILSGSVRHKAARKAPRAMDTSLLIKSDSQHNTDNACFEGTEEEGRSITPIIALDDSDPDDGTSVVYEQTSNETVAPQSNVQEENENDSVSHHSNLRTLDDDDSDYSMPSLYSEVMQRDLNEKSRTESGAYHLEVAETEHSTMAISQEPENDAATSSVEINVIFQNGSDSDDSMPSLYGDAMLESSKEQQNKRNATGTADPNVPTKKPPELCPICGLLTTYLQNHILRRHQRVKKHVCKFCQKRFLYQFDLKRHINTWHEKRIILTCEHCGKGFINHSSHFYHMKNSHGESDVYECEICHRKFKSIDGYRKHLKEHSLVSYQCPDCDKLFKNQRTLQKHQLRYHPS